MEFRKFRFEKKIPDTLRCTPLNFTKARENAQKKTAASNRRRAAEARILGKPWNKTQKKEIK